MKENSLVYRAHFETGEVLEWYAPQNSFKHVLKTFKTIIRDDQTHGVVERFDENGNVIFRIEE